MSTPDSFAFQISTVDAEQDNWLFGSNPLNQDPSWVKFDPKTATFSGTPDRTQSGGARIHVVVSLANQYANTSTARMQSLQSIGTYEFDKTVTVSGFSAGKIVFTVIVILIGTAVLAACVCCCAYRRSGRKDNVWRTYSPFSSKEGATVDIEMSQVAHNLPERSPSEEGDEENEHAAVGPVRSMPPPEEDRRLSTWRHSVRSSRNASSPALPSLDVLESGEVASVMRGTQRRRDAYETTHTAFRDSLRPMSASTTAYVVAASQRPFYYTHMFANRPQNRTLQLDSVPPFLSAAASARRAYHGQRSPLPYIVYTATAYRLPENTPCPTLPLSRPIKPKPVIMKLFGSGDPNRNSVLVNEQQTPHPSKSSWMRPGRDRDGLPFADSSEDAVALQTRNCVGNDDLDTRILLQQRDLLRTNPILPSWLHMNASKGAFYGEAPPISAYHVGSTTPGGPVGWSIVVKRIAVDAKYSSPPPASPFAGGPSLSSHHELHRFMEDNSSPQTDTDGLSQELYAQITMDEFQLRLTE